MGSKEGRAGGVVASGIAIALVSAVALLLWLRRRNARKA